MVGPPPPLPPPPSSALGGGGQHRSVGGTARRVDGQAVPQHPGSDPVPPPFPAAVPALAPGRHSVPFRSVSVSVPFPIPIPTFVSTSTTISVAVPVPTSVPLPFLFHSVPDFDLFRPSPPISGLLRPFPASVARYIHYRHKQSPAAATTRLAVPAPDS